MAVYTVVGVAAGAAAVLLFPVGSGLAAPFGWAGPWAPRLAVVFCIAVAEVACNVGGIDGPGVVVTPGTSTLVMTAALGGPAAAAVVAAVGVTELREVRGVPWYGILANHGAGVVAWVAAAVAMRLVAGPSAAAASALVGLTAVAAGSIVAALIEGMMAALLYAARTGRRPLSAFDDVGGDVAVELSASASLGWLTAQAYALAAWWSPLLLLVGLVAVSRSLTRRRDTWQLRHHPLTSLPNGLGLRERAAAMRGSLRGLAVLYLDLDGFKAVNDDYGHAVGDDVLRAVGGRLRAACRPGDVLAHLHGDEFVGLAPGVVTDADAGALAARLVAAVEPAIEHEAGVLRVSASVGHRIVADPAILEAAIREADRAMSEAKAAKGRRRGDEQRGSRRY